MKIVAIIQARVDSIRLPNKVMKLINGLPLIEILIKRLNKSKELSKIIVATSKKKTNTKLVKHIQKLGFTCEIGSENDVLARYYKIAKKYKADIVVRITGDCPLIDASVVDEIIKKFKSINTDYISNTILPSYPDGLDTEVFTYSSLEKAYNNTNKSYDREHVTPFLKRSNLIKKYNFKDKHDNSHLRWTVDDIDDFLAVSKVFKEFSPNIYFSWKDVLNLHKKIK